MCVRIPQSHHTARCAVRRAVNYPVDGKATVYSASPVLPLHARRERRLRGNLDETLTTLHRRHWHNVRGMPRPSHAIARRSWWWVFALFIATPALALAFLGLEAIRAEDSEERQRLLEGQQQVLRLTGAAIDTALEREVSEARVRLQAGASPGIAALSPDSPILFQRDRRGVLAFPEQRVFFSADAAGLGFAAGPDPAVAVLVDAAGAAAAQGRGTEAARLYARLREVPTLRAWAELQVLLLRPDGVAAVAATADAQLTTSDVRSPAGIPLAIVISSLCGELRPAKRLRFLPFVERTLHIDGGARASAADPDCRLVLVVAAQPDHPCALTALEQVSLQQRFTAGDAAVWIRRDTRGANHVTTAISRS